MLGIAVMAKSLARGFNDSKVRVAFEADLVAKGIFTRRSHQGMARSLLWDARRNIRIKILAGIFDGLVPSSTRKTHVGSGGTIRHLLATIPR
jgi:hypothetical protein